jgi:hypothetical protein
VCCFMNKAQLNRAGPPERSRISIQTVRTATSAPAKVFGCRPLTTTPGEIGPRVGLLCCLPEIDNEVIERFHIFDAGEDHLLTWDKLVGIGEILLERIFVPDHS